MPGLTDGRVYSGRQAVELKLVDEIGDEKDAKRWLQKERAVAPGLSVVEWKPKTESGGVLSWLFGSIGLGTWHLGCQLRIPIRSSFGRT